MTTVYPLEPNYARKILEAVVFVNPDGTTNYEPIDILTFQKQQDKLVEYLKNNPQEAELWDKEWPPNNLSFMRYTKYDALGNKNKLHGSFIYESREPSNLGSPNSYGEADSLSFYSLRKPNESMADHALRHAKAAKVMVAKFESQEAKKQDLKVLISQYPEVKQAFAVAEKYRKKLLALGKIRGPLYDAALVEYRHYSEVYEKTATKARSKAERVIDF